MSANLQKQKLNLVESILGMDTKKVKALTSYIETLDKPKAALSAELLEEIRLGDEDIAAGRVHNWADVMEEMQEVVKKGGEEYEKKHG